MHSSLKSLLEKTEENISKIEENQSQTTGIIIGLHKVDNYEILLLHQLRVLKKYVNEIIISKSENLEINDSNLLLELDAISVKIVERSDNSEIYSTNTLTNLFNNCSNDRVFLIPFDLLD